MVQHNFGNETKQTSTTTIEDVIVGSVFTITEAGTGDSITAAFRCDAAAWTGKIKCAIYLGSDHSFVANGVTEERTLTLSTTVTWFTFNFVGTKPSLTINTAYVLVAWAQSVAENCYIMYTGGDANQGHHQAIAYNSFPNPLVPVETLRKCSIYCTYTVAGAGVTVKKGSGLAATMTEMLNSKMLFSACNRFPKLTTRRF
jgi:hypothetical protein